MKSLLLLALVVVIGKVGFDRFMESRTERVMSRIAAEINQKLPMTAGNMRIEKVEYGNRLVRYSGTLLDGQEMTLDFKNRAHDVLKAQYCGNGALQRANVGAEYAFTSVGMRSMNDKVRAESWSVAIRPESCN